MKYHLSFELPGLPKGLNGSHGLWQVAHGRRKMWRNMSSAACFLKAPSAPLTNCRIECTRYSSAPSDYDNLVASFKPIIDGLIDGKIISDDSEKVVLERMYKNEKARPKQGKVKIEVFEL